METSARVRYPTDEDIVLIGSNKDTRTKNCVFMIPITENQKACLAEKEYFSYDCSIGNLIIDNKDIYLLGNLELDSEEDVSFIRNRRLTWCNDKHAGTFIPRNYDYSTNTGDIIDSTDAKVGRCAYIETFDNLKMFLFGHARLGYPTEVCVFRRIVILKDN